MVFINSPKQWNKKNWRRYPAIFTKVYYILKVISLSSLETLNFTGKKSVASFGSANVAIILIYRVSMWSSWALQFSSEE